MSIIVSDSDLSRKSNFYREFDRPKYSEKTDRKMSVATPRVVKLSSELVLVEKRRRIT
jgi:hypothetical protein